MGYYTRVFCTSSKLPSFGELVEHVKSLRHDYLLEDDQDAPGANDRAWAALSLTYKKGKLPILIELNRTDDDEGLAKEEIQEFLEEIGTPWLSLNKRKVINHLRDTNYIVACQLPISDIDDEGYVANSEFLQYFIDNYGGMLQADGEGFYSGGDIIVKV